MRRATYRILPLSWAWFLLFLAPSLSLHAQSLRLTDPLTWTGHDGDVTAVAVSPDGRMMLSGGTDRVLKLWDLDRGHLRGTFRGHGGAVWTAVWSPDRRLIVSGSEDHTVKIWDAASRLARHTLTLTDPVYAVDVSPDRLWLAASSGDRTARVWNFRQPGRPVTVGRTDLAGHVRFIPGGMSGEDRLAVATDSRSVLLWDPVLKAPAGSLDGASSPVAVSPDGRWLASGSGRNYVIRLWNAATRTVTATFEGHANLVSTLAFSPDGRWLASGSWDHTIRIWDTQTGRSATALPEDHAVWSVAFSPDGAVLVAGESEGVIKRWTVRGAASTVASAEPGPAPPRFIDENVDAVAAASLKRPDALGVIFGVEDYRYAPAVSYARRDATVMREYFVRTFGIDAGNVYVRTDRDATQGEFRKVFDPDQGWLARRIRPGETEVFVYFVGHGAPDVATGEAYLMPADGDPNYPATSYRLEELYRSLDRLPARQTTVILDACFSGRAGRGERVEMLLEGARGIGVEPKQAQVGERTVVLTASTGHQVSSSYPEKSHGLFTYFFMLGLKGAADANQDRIITVGELYLYLREQVTTQAGRLDREQTPELIGTDVHRVLTRY